MGRQRRAAWQPRRHAEGAEQDIKAPVRACVAGFRTAKALAGWYDAEARLTGFRVGGAVAGSYYPSYDIVAIVPDQLIAHRYTSVVDGVGLWSFVARGKSTRVQFDHIAEGNTGTEVPSRTFHWQGLMENLAALVERRPVPVVNGVYQGKLPRGILHATMNEAVAAAKL